MNFITFYKSSICPRCAIASKVIEEVGKDTGTEVKKIDVVKHPLLTLRDGVKWIPAIKIGETVYYRDNLKKENLFDLIDRKFN